MQFRILFSIFLMAVITCFLVNEVSSSKPVKMGVVANAPPHVSTCPSGTKFNSITQRCHQVW